MKSTALTNVLLILILGCLLFLCIMIQRPLLVNEPVAIEGYHFLPKPPGFLAEPVKVEIVR